MQLYAKKKLGQFDWIVQSGLSRRRNQIFTTTNHTAQIGLFPINWKKFQLIK